MPPHGIPATPLESRKLYSADGRIRTDDPLFTNQDLSRPLNCPGFDGGSILWEDVAHASIEPAVIEAFVAAPVPTRNAGASDQDGARDHQGDGLAPRRADPSSPRPC